MKLSTKPYKGARDYYPEDKRLQKELFNYINRVCERFGYQEYDGPILEPTELYVNKTSDEIVNDQTYTFEDRGGRSVTIRTEMTPTVSRMVAARRQELVYPLRWYSIPNLWRYERPQRGRGREFYQLNVDLFGVSEITAETEVIQLADAILKEFGAPSSAYTIKINSRELVDYFLKSVLKLNETQSTSLIRIIDRRDKLESANFNALLDALFTPSQRDSGGPNKLLTFLNCKELSTLPIEVKDCSARIKLDELFSNLHNLNVANIEFSPSLMRGFDYYTGIVFEVFDNHPDNRRSMFGGGRYDNLIGSFGVEPVPTVGFGMGDLTLENFLGIHNLTPKVNLSIDLGVLVISKNFQAVNLAIKELRDMGLNVSVDLTSRKLDKQIQSFVKQGLKYIAFIGDEELAKGQLKLKNLVTGKEEFRSPERLVSIVKDTRAK
jgi:histidyl-tRNA synthetase